MGPSWHRRAKPNAEYRDVAHQECAQGNPGGKISPRATIELREMTRLYLESGLAKPL
jgi:hypothetical protein